MTELHPFNVPRTQHKEILFPFWTILGICHHPAAGTNLISPYWGGGDTRQFLFVTYVCNVRRNSSCQENTGWATASNRRRFGKTDLMRLVGLLRFLLQLRRDRAGLWNLPGFRLSARKYPLDALPVLGQCTYLRCLFSTKYLSLLTRLCS